MEKKLGLVELSLLTARAILQVRPLRRKLMFYNVLVVVALVVLGTWPLAGWLEESLWLMALFWGGVMILTIFMMLLALYDMLAVVKEYKDRKGDL